MKNEMLAYLCKIYAPLVEDWKDFAEIAIYWFAADHHNGQSSELYSILSTSPYSPSCLSKGLKSEGEIVNEMYEDLEYFVKGRIVKS